MSPMRQATYPLRMRALSIAVALAAGIGLTAALPAFGRPHDDPEAVVKAYVQAMLSGNSDAAAPLTCRRPDLGSFQHWQQDVADRRTRHDLPPLDVAVTAYQDDVAGDSVNASADVAITLTGDGQPQERLTRPFTFVLTDEDGWKVCFARAND